MVDVAEDAANMRDKETEAACTRTTHCRSGIKEDGEKVVRVTVRDNTGK